MTKDSYQKRQDKYNELYTLKSAVYNRVSIVRVLLFLAFFALGYGLIHTGEYLIFVLTLFIFPLIFGSVVKKHNRIKFDRDQLRFLAEINQQEVDRIEGKLHAFNEGLEYKDELHPYSADLDLFGRNSLFQLVSRASTPTGRDTLATWLLRHSNNQEIVRRQIACKELANYIDWRQRFQALGMHDYEAKSDYKKLNDWLRNEGANKNHVVLKIASYLIPVVTISMFILNLTMGISIYFFFGMLAVNGLILKQFLDKVQEITEDTNNNVGILRSYGRLIAEIEQSTFDSEFLLDRQSNFLSPDFSASKAVQQLRRLLDFLNSRANMLYGLVNLTLLVDIHLVLAANKWKIENASQVSHWFEAIGEIEAINSLASFAHSNPGYSYPSLIENEYYFEAKNLGHPLIFVEERVSNDFSLIGSGRTAIITGSNMSGKSTFLRTLGINAVLAFLGAPCCSSEISLSNFQVFTGMRTQDNLEEHVSSFYAELKRIKQLLKTVEKNERPVFFLLDEILKGTNSKDRHLGSASLVKQLSHENAFGLVSTHDLELGELASSMDSVVNYSFNSDIKGDEILFDYKLTDGICKSFNASKLMENMGIKIVKS